MYKLCRSILGGRIPWGANMFLSNGSLRPQRCFKACLTIVDATDMTDGGCKDMTDGGFFTSGKKSLRGDLRGH